MPAALKLLLRVASIIEIIILESLISSSIVVPSRVLRLIIAFNVRTMNLE